VGLGTGGINAAIKDGVTFIKSFYFLAHSYFCQAPLNRVDSVNSF